MRFRLTTLLRICLVISQILTSPGHRCRVLPACGVNAMTGHNLCRVTREGLFTEAPEAREASAFESGGAGLIERLRRTADALAEAAIVQRRALSIAGVTYGDAGLPIAGQGLAVFAGGVAIAGGIAGIGRCDGADPTESGGCRTDPTRLAVSTTEGLVVA